jgi:putative peptidoglycan lipid II flippase
LIAYSLLKKRIGGLNGFGVSRSTIKFVLAALPAAALGICLLWLLGGIGAGSFALGSVLGAVSTSVLVGSLMGISYLLMLWLFSARELNELFAALGGRFGRREKAN